MGRPTRAKMVWVLVKALLLAAVVGVEAGGAQFNGQHDMEWARHDGYATTPIVIAGPSDAAAPPSPAVEAGSTARFECGEKCRPGAHGAPYCSTTWAGCVLGD